MFPGSASLRVHAALIDEDTGAEQIVVASWARGTQSSVGVGQFLMKNMSIKVSFAKPVKLYKKNTLHRLQWLHIKYLPMNSLMRQQ